MRRALLSLALIVPLFAGCSPAEKAPLDDDFSDLAQLDEKSDSFSYRMTIVGSLTYGETSKTINYNKTPRFRAFKFAGEKGDAVDTWIRSSNGGDAVGWILDNSFKVIASNDDASYSTYDSNMKVTLPGNKNAAIKTYYIVFRDYDLRSKKFTVKLTGTPANDFFSCTADSDCVAVTEHKCCPNCALAAVNKDQTDAYSSQPLICAAVLCPVACLLDERVAQCNFGTNKCEMVAIEDIACGGRTIHRRGCPAGYECTGAQMAWDAPGNCTPVAPAEEFCGGIAGISCSKSTDVCIDDPNDSCDPDNGGADCGGVCRDAVLCSGITAKCAPNFHWSKDKCNCVPNTPTDCRTTGCESGTSCQPCWFNFACVPDGAVC